MSKLIVEMNTKHKLYNNYVKGVIHGIGMASLYLDGVTKPKHYAIRRTGDTERLTFEGTDNELMNIVNLITVEYSGEKFEGLYRFSGTYPWND